ncbi:NitT/TauT family transport system substrate-binding protein [Fontibacillus phaseoli]|uniref:NitT/TauT family transport system substrate-binding protein n=1 Tax=Fontibacillus phaseoli TaxID=1416533 RepID=A0A369BC71_9BACL|nr:ABC transporter substrate-binding protein [Fontibacillus phaseoli]RCX19152.1 NitT/TauT family transport system substrate-binding protein [Fontibacillus phaseoli]
MRHNHRLSRITLTLALAAMIAIVSACGGKSAANSQPDTATPAKAAGGTKELVIAEPVHSTGYLPLYIAIRKGLFEDVNVKVVTLSGGSAHTNAVLTDQAFGFIGGPEHNAFAKAKGAELRAVVNIVNRGNVYLVARSGLDPGTDIAAFMKGKIVAVSQYGGTPNSIIRYLAKEWGHELDKDITLKEVDNGAIPAILQQGQGDVAVVTEPVLTQGIQEGIWGQPFYNVPQELGPYAYSTINIKQDSITDDPETVQKFVTGIQKGLEFLRDNHEESMEIARQEFPTMAEDLLETTLNRSYEDEMWEYTGQISEEAVTTGLSVVLAAGLLKDDAVGYGDIIDTQFVK